MNNVYSRTFVLALAGLLTFAGCSDAEPQASNDNTADEVTLKTGYEADLVKYNSIYGTRFTSLDDAFTVKVKVGTTIIPAPTHLFGETVNVIPYSNEDNVRTAENRVFKRGDSVIAQVFKKGQLGIAVKHHRSQFPELDLATGSKAELKEHLKLQDTHIEIVVGVERDGKPGAITVNNPQDYEEGKFGDEEYAMIFLRPVYPGYLNAAQQKAFEDNTRTMLLGFNAVTNFPNDYNGGDPLGARDPDKVRESVKQMVLAINGSEEAREWFQDPQHQVYCAELAFLSFSAGLIVPLNDASMIPLVGASEWTLFKDSVARHNAGEETAFLNLNANKRVGLVRDLALAPDDLRTAASYGPSAEANKLALVPLTSADIIEEFLRTHIPREIAGEALAPAQGAILAAMRPGLMEQMSLDQLPPSDPRRVAVDTLFDKLVAAVGTSYANYAAYRTAIEPLLVQARQLTGPRGDSGEGLFVPPSIFHVAAQGKRKGLLSFQYEGHGIHVSAVRRIAGPGATPNAQPTPVSQIATTVSCVGACGGLAAGGCYCDQRCGTDPAGCCSDFAAACR